MKNKKAIAGLVTAGVIIGGIKLYNRASIEIGEQNTVTGQIPYKATLGFKVIKSSINSKNNTNVRASYFGKELRIIAKRGEKASFIIQNKKGKTLIDKHINFNGIGVVPDIIEIPSTVIK